jgi:hypothetical protein
MNDPYCKSKQVTDFIAWPSRCHVRIQTNKLWLKVRNKRQKYDERTLASIPYFPITCQFSKGPSFVLVSKIISLHSDLVYTYEQQIFIDEIQVYSRRHIQLSSTRDDSGGQPSIFCFARFHWSERFSELY